MIRRENGVFGAGALDRRGDVSHIWRMNYIVALLLPPFSIMLAGRPFLGVLVLIIWIPALLMSGGLTHPMFILLAWFLIFHAREDKRERAYLDGD